MINKIPDNLPINTIKLTIENSSIKSIESSEIEKLINLRVLNASNNRIESIDKEVREHKFQIMLMLNYSINFSFLKGIHQTKQFGNSRFVIQFIEIIRS